MKVLVVSHEWDRLQPGGAQASAAALADGLSGLDGVSVTLVSAVDSVPSGFPPDGRTRPNAVVERLVESRTDSAYFAWSDVRFAENWRRLLVEERPDVVHLHHYFYVGVDVARLVRLVVPNAVVVLTLHEMMAICLRSGQMVDGHENLCVGAGIRRCADCVDWSAATVAARTDYVRRALGDVDAFVAPSQFVRRRYLDWGLQGRASAQITVLPNALPALATPPANPTDARVAQGRAPWAGRGLRLAFLGQHTPFKGLRVLLDAVGQVRRVAPAALDRVDVFGDGSDRFSRQFHDDVTSALRAAAPLVRALGRYAQSDVPRILADTDAIVVPSTWWENSPVVIEEALAAGVPVICSDIGGMAEKVRDGIDGWHFPVGNATALADLIVRIASMPDVDLSHLRRPADLTHVAREHVRLYRDTLARRTDPSE